ncbi:MAG: type II secretion system protein M [Acidobacteria bacterium]|nr:type II secretion system protein M [Acidobacteriota bacterium]
MNLMPSSVTRRDLIALGALAAVALACLLAINIIPSLRLDLAAARSRLADASALLEWSAQGATGTSSSVVQPVPAEQRSQKLIDLANRTGLPVSRLQNTERGIVIQFDKVSAQALFVWLAEAERDAGLVPTEAVIESEADGRITASLSFAGG